MLNDILVQVLSGVTRGMLLFIVASGLTLILGVLKIINFAHGSFYMVAAYCSYTSYTLASLVLGQDVGFVAAVLVAPLVVTLLGVCVERFLLHRIAAREHQYQLILTFALTLIIYDLTKMVWGKSIRSFVRPTFLQGSIEIFSRPFPSYYVVLIVIGIIILVGLWLLLKWTRLGKVIRAAVSDQEMVNALGVNVPFLNTLVFGIGAWLAGLGGALAAPVGAITLGMDSTVVIESFAVVLIGGMGNFVGAFVGAMIIGLMQSFGILFFPRLAIAFIFITFCAVLIIKPQGLLGKRV